MAESCNFLILFSVLLPVVNAISFQIHHFDPDVTSISYRGDAARSVGATIQLNTLYFKNRVGQAVYSDPIPIWDLNSGEVANFTTHFTFQIDTQGGPNQTYGDGMAFFLASTDYQIPINSGGGFLGLFNSSNMYSSQNHIVSVEWDTFANKDWDPGYEHVGINVNTLSSSTTAPWSAFLHRSETADAWIVYNSSTKNLTVYWSYGSNPNSSLSYAVDLKEVLPEWVMIGFSAATGPYVEWHTLSSWEWNSDLDRKPAVDLKVNERKKKWSTGLIVGLSVAGGISLNFVGLFLITCFLRKQYTFRSKVKMGLLNSSLNNDLERGTGPKRFSYRDLVIATNNFSGERKLGEGGCGDVYKGELIDMNISVAVKKFSRSSKQGKKQYITEVKIISSLRHRNLVQLIGWCHDDGEFLLVYEYLPNRSLDYHLFGQKNNNVPLSWGLRYKIALGIASGLLYLHEEWEQCVVHRDIKASNIMLDSGFNVKLGDFGLAKFMDHELGPQTTGLAGTFGYLAPEYISTGRASKESDVYSFGIVALEIASGRKSVDIMTREDGSDTGLLGYVWDLYGSEKLASIVDERMKNEFDMNQVECLLIVGLWCGHPNPSLRPSIRQAIQVLNFEAALPKLPTEMPVPMYAPVVEGFIPSNSDPSLSFSDADIGR